MQFYEKDVRPTHDYHVATNVTFGFLLNQLVDVVGLFFQKFLFSKCAGRKEPSADDARLAQHQLDGPAAELEHERLQQFDVAVRAAGEDLEARRDTHE